jgi:ABC-type Fe3+-hydroxamate transport system substrate-binding protein
VTPMPPPRPDPPAALVDAAGAVHAPAGDDARIVCLVPSVTELLCTLGLGDRLVGRTGFCIHPWETVRAVPKVGGTKDVRLEKVRALAPTHVVVNVDENLRETAEALAAFVRRPDEAERLCAAFEAAHARAAAAAGPPSDVLYLIWREPWMAVAPSTYIAQTLALLGWRTVPAAPEPRYPEVDLAAFAGRVDRVLLSSEPYHFKEHHLAEVAAAVPGAAVALVDGEMTSWYGSRAIAGLDYLVRYTAAARV